MTVAEYRAACQTTHDRVVAGDIGHDGQAELRAAWLGAARSWHGDAWVISGRKSGTDVTPAVAVVSAIHGMTRAKIPRAVGG